LDAVRAITANRGDFRSYYENVHNVFAKYNIKSPSQIINVDETMADTTLLTKYVWYRRTPRLITPGLVIN
jgi:hypothetical protein